MDAINIISGILLAASSIMIILAVLFTNTDNTGLSSCYRRRHKLVLRQERRR